ncbi:MAG: B12-binding domain-containing radical SAM protein [Nanoarchaeota archaeon]|nr:B12-binding domain-containing radical SAM protein [Nanoarchaeota archaeon]
MTDVLFIVPPFSYKELDDASSRCPNLGVAMLAAVLEQHKYDVKILDVFALDLKDNEVVEFVKENKPKVIALTSVTANYTQSIHILKLVRSTEPSIPIIYGGPHVTIMPQMALKSEYVDYIVIGEGEETIVELVDFIIQKKGDKKSIKGIGYKGDNSELIINEPRDFIKNIEELPMPAYHLLPMDAYRPYGWLDEGRKFCSMITSRGCPFQCTYCTSSKIFGYRWRYRNAEKVIEEIKLLYDKFGIRHIYFQDDEFTVNHERIMKICDKIIENKLDIIWECLTRVSHVDEELLKKMSQAGCRSILYGIECGYQEGIDKINKKITLQQAIDAVRLSKKYGISPKVTFMMGFPWESEKEIKQTIRFAKKLNADLTFFNTLNPYPGTPLYDDIKNQNLFVGSPDWENYVPHGATPLIKTKYLDEKQLAYWNGRAYFSLYTDPRYILRKMTMITSWKDFKRNSRSAVRLISMAVRRIVKKT